MTSRAHETHVAELPGGHSMHEPPKASPGKLLGFVLFFVVIGGLPPQALYWDGIGFLTWARDPIQLDYGHLLYIPTLRLWSALFAPWFATEEYVAKLLSAFAAAAVFLLLWSRLENERGRKLERGEALVVALMTATTPLFWGEAGRVEPTTLTQAGLLLTAAAAERYGRRPTYAACALLCGAATVTLGYHVISLAAAPWILVLVRAQEGRPPARHALVPAGLLVLASCIAALAGKLDALGRFSGYWLAFLPELDAHSLQVHLAGFWRIVSKGVPLLALFGLLGLVCRVCTSRRAPRTVYLAAPYLAAYLLLGKPTAGLLVPVSLALGLFLGDGLAALPAGSPRRVVVGLVLPLALAVQVGAGIFGALSRAVTPDDEQVKAELLAGGLPDAAILLAGPVAHHLRWFTGAPHVALPNEIHAAEPGPDGKKDPVAIVLLVARREAARFETVYITSEALDYLSWGFGADPGRVPVDEGRRIVLRAAPLLYMVPVALEPPLDVREDG